MFAFELDELQTHHEAQREASGGRNVPVGLYHEFLRVPSMSAGLYSLKAGTTDPQQPHNEDELYYVVRGRGKICVADEDRDVQAGSAVFVAAHVEHRFHTITEDMDILVFFAPAET